MPKENKSQISFPHFFLILTFALFCVFSVWTCKTSESELNKKDNISTRNIDLSPREVRLEFRGNILKIPYGVNPPFELKARVYMCSEWEDFYSPRIALKEYPPCMQTYIEKIQTFEKPEYSIDLDVPSNWSHAYIELLGLDEIIGKFSPGHNPNWFGQSKGEILTFRHDFSFRSQENPIPGAKQEELAVKFAPILVLHKDKKEIPSNLEKYHGRVELGFVDSPKTKSGFLKTRYEKEKISFMILPEPEDIPGYDAKNDPIHIYYHVRYADTQVSGTQAESLPGYRDDRNYWYGKGDGRFVVSYWFWYDRNYGPSRFGNYHQGDFESYSVLVDPKGLPLRLMVTGHDHIMLDTDWKNINSLNHHPILYIATGNKSDGGNPTSAYGDYEVLLDAGSDLLNAIADPRDIFPHPKKNSQIIIPFDLNKEDLSSVLIGASPDLGEYMDLRDNITRTINKLVAWEEPGWIGEPSFSDPDGNHYVDEKIADFLRFPGRIGKHVKSEIKILSLGKMGVSPRNVPFKTNIEQHFTYERPRTERSYSARWGDYGPKFYGNSLTPQFTKTKKPFPKPQSNI